MWQGKPLGAHVRSSGHLYIIYASVQPPPNPRRRHMLLILPRTMELEQAIVCYQRESEEPIPT